MPIPVLVTPPVLPIVGLVDLKAFLRVDHDDDNALITSLGDAAAAWLDGYSGILGRAVMPQTWREDVPGPGRYALTLPNASAVTAEAGGGPVVVETEIVGEATIVTVPDGVGAVTITYGCALPAVRLPAAQAAVKMLVAHWYAHREAVGPGASPATMPLAVDALVAALRWRHL